MIALFRPRHQASRTVGDGGRPLRPDTWIRTIPVAACGPLLFDLDPRPLGPDLPREDFTQIVARFPRSGRIAHGSLRADHAGIGLTPGGTQAVGRFLERLGPHGLGVGLAGLCDAAEEDDFRRALERTGLGTGLTRAGMERLGFYVCAADLEDELIRALGVPAVEEVVAARGELRSFRTLQKQPEWRGRRAEEQLRRFLGSGARRKIGRPKAAPPNPVAEVRRVEEALRSRLQTDVRVTARRRGRGAVTIHYYSNDDLARLLELILGAPFDG